MCRTCDEIQEKTIPLKGHLCPERTFRKLMGKKNKADDNVRALNTLLLVHQGQDRAFLGSALTFCTNWSISVSVSPRLCPCGFSADTTLRHKQQPDAVLASQPAHEKPPYSCCSGLSVGRAPCWQSLVGTLQAAQIILTMVLLLPGKVLCSRRGTCPELRMQVHGRARGRRTCQWKEAAGQGAGARQHCFLSQCSPGNWRKIRVEREETLNHFIVQECFFKRRC